MGNGIYQIINDEGAICKVYTIKGNNTSGPVWADICESALHGKVMEATIQRYQYRTMNGEAIEPTPTGFILKIQDSADAFLPVSLNARFRDFSTDHSGERIAVMVESFDPKSLNLVMREVRVADDNFDIEKINDALLLIGQANEENKYVKGTIIGEKISYRSQNRAAYLISVNGLEAYLNCNDAYYPYDNDISRLVGHNVLASVKQICLERMSIVLSMRAPYQDLVAELSQPMVREKTKGIVNFITPSEVNVLLPQQTIGIIPTRLYPNKTIHDWLSMTGCLVECIPYREKVSYSATRNHQYLVALS